MLVVSAARGEFETGFRNGGQTKEHAVLAKTLGVQQLLVVINKMDMTSDEAGCEAWSEARYDEIRHQLAEFLKATGFKRERVRCVRTPPLAPHRVAPHQRDRRRPRGDVLVAQRRIERFVRRP